MILSLRHYNIGRCMFSNSSKYYDAIYSFKNYSAESEKIKSTISEHISYPAKTLLDVACGTGMHMKFFKPWINVEGIDINRQFIDIAQKRIPDADFFCCDMRDFNLSKKFDVITCLFSAISAMLTTKDLNKAIANMAGHLNPGGLLIIEPWWSPENWNIDGKPRANYVDETDLKITRMSKSGRQGNISTIEFHYLIGTPEGFETFSEKHEYGLFTSEEHMSAYETAGLSVTHDTEGLIGRGLYIGSKPF